MTKDMLFETDNFDSLLEIEDYATRIKIKFITENDGYEIYEILPTKYDYCSDKRILMEIVEKHFPNIELDDNKDYFVYKNNILINGD